MIQTEYEILNFINSEAYKFTKIQLNKKNRATKLEDEIAQEESYVWLQNQLDLQNLFGGKISESQMKIIIRLCGKGYIRFNGRNGLMITELGYKKIGRWRI